MSTTAPLPRFAPSLLLLFACAGGLSVANVYYAQPLLDALSASAAVNVGKCAAGRCELGFGRWGRAARGVRPAAGATNCYGITDRAGKFISNFANNT